MTHPNCDQCGIPIKICAPSENTMNRLSARTGKKFSGPVCSLCIQKLGGSHENQRNKSQINKAVAFSRIALVLAIKRGDFIGFMKSYDSMNAELAYLDRKLHKHINAAHFITSQRNEIVGIRDSINEHVKQSPKAAYFVRRYEANRHTGKPEVRARIFERDGMKCLHCGAIDRLAVDHIIPVCRGGGDEDLNLQTLCIPCNSKKGAS